MMSSWKILYTEKTREHVTSGCVLMRLGCAAAA
jgi:hypothetical protein